VLGHGLGHVAGDCPSDSAAGDAPQEVIRGPSQAVCRRRKVSVEI